MQDIRKFTNKDWATMRVHCLNLAINRGMVKSVVNLLSDEKCVSQILLNGSQEEIEALDTARNWLKKAMDYEKIHGKDSLLDMNDPFVRDKLLPGWAAIRRNKVQDSVQDSLCFFDNP